MTDDTVFNVGTQGQNVFPRKVVDGQLIFGGRGL